MNWRQWKEGNCKLYPREETWIVLTNFPNYLSCFWEALQFIIIAFILVTLMFDSGVILKGELDASHSQGLKG